MSKLLDHLRSGVIDKAKFCRNRKDWDQKPKNGLTCIINSIEGGNSALTGLVKFFRGWSHIFRFKLYIIYFNPSQRFGNSDHFWYHGLDPCINRKLDKKVPL